MKCEVMYILNPDIDQDGKGRLVSHVKDLVKESGGVLSGTDVWGMRKLAYQIDQYTDGYYVVQKFEDNQAGSVVEELDVRLKCVLGIMRFIVVEMEGENADC